MDTQIATQTHAPVRRRTQLQRHRLTHARSHAQRSLPPTGVKLSEEGEKIETRVLEVKDRTI